MLAAGTEGISSSVWFWRENLWAFRIAGYDPTTASANFSASAVNMGAFLQATLAPEEYSRLAAETMLPVCTGGTFLCRASSVTSVQRETWHRLGRFTAPDSEDSSRTNLCGKTRPTLFVLDGPNFYRWRKAALAQQKPRASRIKKRPRSSWMLFWKRSTPS